jgi:hypothetical protein
MTTLVAFASLPFGLRGGTYEVNTPVGLVQVRVSDMHFRPFLTVSARSEMTQDIPPMGIGAGFTSYTWYDHPFVLRTIFGHDMAALGSINSAATVISPLPDQIRLDDDQALDLVRDGFAELSLTALNNLVAVVRHLAHLHHVVDLQRDDIDITVRADDGTVLLEDPLQDELIQREEAHSEIFDLFQESAEWYAELQEILQREEPVALADELLIEAERALLQRFPRQAIATCYTAIEAGISALLTYGMKRQGVSDREIAHSLTARSLPYKLDSLLRKYTGFSLRHHNRTLWQRFGQLTEWRNDVVHRGTIPSAHEADLALQTTRQLLSWLAMVRQRNRA